VGEEDRQPGEGRLRPEGLERAARAVPAALSQKSGEIDVIRIDIVWPGLLAQHLVDLSKEVPKDVIAQHFPAIIQANTVGGHLVALRLSPTPAFSTTARTAREVRRKAPATWQDLTETAKIVQDGERKAGNDKLWGIVFQGRAYEGLTCNGLEWVDSFGGGTIVDGKGKVTINNPKAVAAIKLAGSWIKSIAPKAC